VDFATNPLAVIVDVVEREKLRIALAAALAPTSVPFDDLGAQSVVASLDRGVVCEAALVVPVVPFPLSDPLCLPCVLATVASVATIDLPVTPTSFVELA